MTHTKDTKPTTFHFPEPWAYQFSPYGIVDILAPDTTGEYPQGIYVAEIDTNDVGRFISQEQHEANARRIVAAVNACQGISTEALENGVVKELLASSIKFSEALRNNYSDAQLCLEERDAWRDAIEKAIGRAL